MPDRFVINSLPLALSCTLCPVVSFSTSASLNWWARLWLLSLVMADSGRGVGLTSATRRVTRSASREAATAQTQARTAQRQPVTRRASKQPANVEEEEGEERKDEAAEAEEEQDATDRLVSPEYQQVKSDLLNEPPLSKAKRVYEYINREHYRDIEREKQQYQAAVAREEEEEREAAQPKMYNLLFSDPTNRSTLYTLLVASVVMLLAPLATFYGVSAVLEAAGWQDKWRLSISGMSAVVVVNVISIGFGLYAYWEKEDEETAEERETREGRSRAEQDQWVRHVTKGQMVGVGKWNEEKKQERDEAQQAREKRG